MEDKLIRVLIIEDSPNDLRLIMEMLNEVNCPSFELTSADRLENGLKALINNGFDILLLDLTLPDSTGLDTFASVYDQAPEVPIVILSGFDDEGTAVKAVREGAQDYLVKGQVNSLLLSRSISYAIERKLIEDELIRHRYYLNELVEKRTEELEETNQCLQEEIREKEILIEEIYRRIQFTLQITAGIIGITPSMLQMEDFDDLNIKSQTRVNAIMKLNEILERSEDFALVNFYKYTSDLIEYLFEIYGLSRNQFKVNLDMDEVLVDISTAIPLGIILNELLSDKLKYHYYECTIDIRLKSMKGNIKLSIKFGDDCREKRYDEALKKPYLQLIDTLLRQFNGRMDFHDEGNEIEIVLHEIKL